MFMLAEQDKIFKSTQTKPTMKEMPDLCYAKWQNLSILEKSAFEAQAKEQKNRTSPQNDSRRRDNMRQIISERKNPLEEERKRRNFEIQEMMALFKNKDLRNIPIAIIDFQVLYDEPQEPHIPVEVGVVWMTLHEGIKREYQRIINPGDPPQGNRSIAVEHSEKYHKIPVDFDKGDTNFQSIWSELEGFVSKDSDEMPPLYCLSSNRDKVMNCIGYIHSRGAPKKPDRFTTFYCIEDLVSVYLLMSGKIQAKPAESQIFDTLIQNRWDYTSSIRCSFHEDVDSAFCSISIVKRYSFVIFDMLSGILEFPLTARHMPDERNACFKVVPAPASKERPRWSQSKSVASSRTVSPPSFREPVPAEDIERIVINEDSSESSDDVEDDEDNDNRPSCTLKELRQPFSAASMLHFRPIGPALRPPMPVKLPFGRGTSVALPTGQTELATPPPPPGFSQLADFSQPAGFNTLPGTIDPPTGFPRLCERDMVTNYFPGLPLNLATASESSFPVESRGRGITVTAVTSRGRGRGLPPQA
ncbi:hypothetical protein Btru_021340 [Bulinus truncatus]|nr:hypothetical protein Btru_021340 [Bulinus truncatus]